MEDQRSTQCHQGGEAADQVEVTDRGILDGLLGRKKEEEGKKHEEEMVTGMEKVSVEEPAVKTEEHEGHAGEKKESLLSKLHRSSSSSSSSSDEEEEEVIDENGEVIKRKKKKGLKEKIKEKLPGHKDHEGEHMAAAPAPPAPVMTHGDHHDTNVVVTKIEDIDVKTEAPHAPEEEKKGFLEKIKEKLPGGKKPEDATAAPPAAPAPVHAPAAPVTEEAVSSPVDGKEKKGILGKIMDKIPGYNKATVEDDHKAATSADEHKSNA